MHLITHSEEKSSKCNRCNYSSPKAGNLRKHLKVHSGEKANKCNQCDFAFAQTSHLRRHLKKHSAEKQTDAIGVTFQPFKQAIRGRI